MSLHRASPVRPETGATKNPVHTGGVLMILVRWWSAAREDLRPRERGFFQRHDGAPADHAAILSAGTADVKKPPRVGINEIQMQSGQVFAIGTRQKTRCLTG